MPCLKSAENADLKQNSEEGKRGGHEISLDLLIANVKSVDKSAACSLCRDRLVYGV